MLNKDHHYDNHYYSIDIAIDNDVIDIYVKYKHFH